MSRFQVTIVSAGEAAQAVESDDRLGVRQLSKTGDAIIDRIDELKSVWDIVIEKLSGLASQSQSDSAAAVSPYELKSIEFHIGIDAGLSIGLVTKGDASVSVTFERKGAAGSAAVVK